MQPCLLANLQFESCFNNSLEATTPFETFPSLSFHCRVKQLRLTGSFQAGTKGISVNLAVLYDCVRVSSFKRSAAHRTV